MQYNRCTECRKTILRPYVWIQYWNLLGLKTLITLNYYCNSPTFTALCGSLHAAPLCGSLHAAPLYASLHTVALCGSL